MPCPTTPYLTKPNPAPPNQTPPCQALVDKCEIIHTSPYRTMPNQAPPSRTISCRAIPNRTAPNRTAPHPTGPDLASTGHIGPYLTSPNRTKPNLAEPYPTEPSHALFSVKLFGCKTAILGTPVAKTNLRTSVIYPFIDLRRIYQSIFHMKRNYGRPFFEYWAHAGHAGHFDAHKGAKAKVVIREEFICRARAIIFQLRVLQAKAARFCYLTFFGLLSAIHDHGIDHVSGQNRAIFIEIQTRQKFQPCNFFIISFGLLCFGRDLFEQFRPFVQLICRLTVVHDQWGGRSQLVFQSLPSHD